MAKQSGILPIEGTIGNITFFKSKDGYLVKSKGGVNGSRIASDSAFQRTRENNAEFGRAGKGSKLLRTAFRITITKAKDSRMISRLTAAMLKVVQADETSDRGMRNVIDGEAAMLEGFDFNSGAKLSATLFAPYVVDFNRQSGSATIGIDNLVTKTLIAAPAGTTHVRLFAGAASIDFETEDFDSNTGDTDPLVYNMDPQQPVSLAITLPAGSTHPVFIALGVEFLQSVNKKMYSLNNGAFNACAIIKVSVPEPVITQP